MSLSAAASAAAMEDAAATDPRSAEADVIMIRNQGNLDNDQGNLDQPGVPMSLSPDQVQMTPIKARMSHDMAMLRTELGQRDEAIASRDDVIASRDATFRSAALQYQLEARDVVLAEVAQGEAKVKADADSKALAMKGALDRTKERLQTTAQRSQQQVQQAVIDTRILYEQESAQFVHRLMSEAQEAIGTQREQLVAEAHEEMERRKTRIIEEAHDAVQQERLNNEATQELLRNEARGEIQAVHLQAENIHLALVHAQKENAHLRSEMSSRASVADDSMGTQLALDNTIAMETHAPICHTSNILC